MKDLDMTRIAAALLAASLLSTTAYAAPNLVSNGDFNSATYTVNTQFGTSYSQANQQGVTGWIGNNGYDLFFTSAAAATTQNALGQYSGTGNEKLWGPIAPSAGGGSFVALDGDQTNGVQGGISQSISGLSIGTVYQVAFDWGAGQVQSRTGNTTEQLQVSLGGETHATAVVADSSGSFSGWQHAVLNFTATATTETLKFLSVGTPNGLPPIATLDDVSLVAVPEPMSIALLGVGLAGLGFARRRRAA